MKIHIDGARQELELLDGERVLKRYSVSTAKNQDRNAVGFDVLLRGERLVGCHEDGEASGDCPVKQSTGCGNA